MNSGRRTHRLGTVTLSRLGCPKGSPVTGVRIRRLGQEPAEQAADSRKGRVIVVGSSLASGFTTGTTFITDTAPLKRRT